MILDAEAWHKSPATEHAAAERQALWRHLFQSFFAFGLFEVARQSGFFPEPWLAVVESILEEEARHIVFFANWEAYQQCQRGHGLAPLRAARALRYYSRAVRRRLGAVRSSAGVGFTRRAILWHRRSTSR